MFWFGPRLVDEAACGDFIAVDEYLKAGDDVNERNQLGSSALHVAAEFNHIAVFKLVLRCKNIDVNLQDSDGQTALMKAATKGNSTVANTLCQRSDINVNIRDNNGRTALLHARGNVSIVKILLKVPHMNVRLTGRSNCNPFQLACLRGKTKLVRVMIRTEITFRQLSRKDLQYGIYLAKTKGNMAISTIIMRELYNRILHEVVQELFRKKYFLVSCS